MKVKELIEKLKTLEQDLDVYFSDNEFGETEIHSITVDEFNYCNWQTGKSRVEENRKGVIIS